MLDYLVKSVTVNVGDSLISKLGLNEKQSKEAIACTGEATLEIVTNQLNGGNMESLMNLFSSKPNNPIANGIQDQIVSLISEKLSGKMNFSKSQIQGVIEIVLPIALSYITKKNEETPEDDPTPLMNIFGGTNKGDLGKAAGGFLKDLF